MSKELLPLSVVLWQPGHTMDIWAVTAINNNTIATGSVDKTIKIWDVNTGQERMTLTGHNDAITAMDSTKDGRYLVSGSFDETIRIWDLEFQTCKTISRKTKGIWSIAIITTPKEYFIVSGNGDHSVKKWDLSGNDLGTIACHRDWVRALATSSDGKYCVSGADDKQIIVVDLQDETDFLKLLGHEGKIHALAITPDNRQIISGSTDKTLRIWDIESGEQLKVLKGHSGSIWGVVITPDGKSVISTGNDKTIRIWDIETGKCVKQWESEHEDWIRTLAITPDGKKIITGSFDCTARVWDLKNGHKEKTLQNHPAYIQRITTTEDGKSLVTGYSDRTVKLWDIKFGKQISNEDWNWKKLAAAVETDPLIWNSIFKAGHLVASFDTESLLSRLQSGSQEEKTKLLSTLDIYLHPNKSTSGAISGFTYLSPSEVSINKEVEKHRSHWRKKLSEWM